MKKVVGCMLVWMLICTACFAYASEDATEMELDTFTYKGHIVHVQSENVQAFPLPLKQIKLGAGKPKNKTILQTLEENLKVHPSFKAGTNNEKWFFEYDAIPTAYPGVLETFLWMEKSKMFPIKNQQIDSMYEACLNYLNALGIKGTRNTGVAGFFKGNEIQMIKEGESIEGLCLAILIPYDVDGLSTNYPLCDRGSVPGEDTSKYIMDFPYAEFLFDDAMQLTHLRMPFYKIVDEEIIEGTPIAWQEALSNALDEWLRGLANSEKRTEDENHKITDEEVDAYVKNFFETQDLRITHIIPMWRADWYNICQPGWCIQIQVYDKITGALQWCYHPIVPAV